MINYQNITNYDAELAEFFTNVEQLQDLFKRYIVAEKLPKRIMVIHGVGGIGKTSLLRMFRLHCAKAGIAVALASGDEAKSAVDVLAKWFEELMSYKVRLRTFDRTLSQYKNIQAKVDEQARKLVETRGKATIAAGKIAQKTAEAATGTAISVALGASIPVIGPLIGALSGALVSTGTEELMDFLRGFLSKPEVDLLLYPADKLSNAFLKDVNISGAKCRLVLMLDTFEQMMALEDWGRDLLQKLHPNIFVVIAGRALPNWSRQWPEWLAHAHVEELTSMTEEDMRALVWRYYRHIQGGKRPSNEQIESIVQFARGLPMVVNSAVRLFVEYGVEDFHSIKAEVIADLADRIREGVSEEMYPVFEAAATLRQFNKESLSAMVGSTVVNENYDNLRRFPFVRSRSGQFAFHDTVREIMNENLLTHEPEKYKKLHKQAVNYYQKNIETVPESDNRLLLELVYHSICVDEKDGVNLLDNLLREARRFWTPELQSKLINDAQKISYKDEHHKYLIKYREGGITSDWQERVNIYEELLSRELKDELRMRVLRASAQPLSYRGEKEKAHRYMEEALSLAEKLGDGYQAAYTRIHLSWHIDDLEESLKLISLALTYHQDTNNEIGIARAEDQLGWHYLRRWDPEESRKHFQRSLEIRGKMGHRRKVAFITERIGQTYLIEGNNKQAILHKEKALEVFEELNDTWSIAWTLDELATCYIEVGRWNQALNLIERAISVFSEWQDRREAACLVRKGFIYQLQDRYDQAMEIFQTVIDRFGELSSWSAEGLYSGIGYVYFNRGDYEQALTYFQKVVDSFELRRKKISAKLSGGARLGDYYSAIGDFDEAINQYQKSLNTAKRLGSHSYWCRALLRLLITWYQLKKWVEVDRAALEIEKIGNKYPFHYHFSILYLVKAQIAWSGDIPAWGTGFKSALHYYQESLIHALNANRYRLDDNFVSTDIYRAKLSIIPYCQARGEEGKKMLTALLDWWQTGTNDTGIPREENISLIPEGIPLLEAEKLARQNEPGDDSPQKTVVENLTEAINSWGN